MGLGLQSMGTRLEDAHTRTALQLAIDDLDRVIREIRRVIFDLGAPVADGAGLHAELERIAASERPALGFEPTLSVSGELDDIDRTVAAHLSQVVREAVSNVARHARATACEVRVLVDDDTVTVEVTDDGTGPPAADISTNAVATPRTSEQQPLPGI